MFRVFFLITALLTAQASAKLSLIYDTSTKMPGPAVSAPEVAALKRLYAAKKVAVCGDFAVNLRPLSSGTA